MKTRLEANVLPTVIVVCVLLLLAVTGMIWLWESDTILFSRTNYLKTQRDNIESGFKLYENYPQVIDRLDADYSLQLYDSIPASRIKISRSRWGLYEAVSIESASHQYSTCIMGGRKATATGESLIYRNNSTTLTLTCNTNIRGRVKLPQGGVIYGQMNSVFFCGGKINPSQISASPDELPAPGFAVEQYIAALRELPAIPLSSDSIVNPFYGHEALMVEMEDGMLTGCRLSGNVILRGETIRLNSTCRTEDILIIARSVTVGTGFKGSVQIFASDTVILEQNAVLSSPSGIYIYGDTAKGYIGIGRNCRVDGYAIAATNGEHDIQKPNYRQSCTARLRGLLYVSGIAQLQGIVSGTVVLGEAVYYSPQGYYRNLISDASILENDVTAYPLFLDPAQRRKEARWVN